MMTLLGRSFDRMEYMMQSTTQFVTRYFPQLLGTWGYINLDEIARDLAPLLDPLCAQPHNPFLDPEYCEGWKKFIHKMKGLDYSWGGYLEDRAVVWAGHYQQPGHTLHVGVDLYVPTDTDVCCPVKAKLVYSTVDLDREGGWGGRMVFEYKDEHIILAHLKGMRTGIGATCLPGSIIARIAEPELNGGWSPHLHVQRVMGRTLKEVLEVDGYLKPYVGIEKDFPDPVQLW